MFKKKQIWIVLVATMMASTPVSANVGTGMNDLFNSVGGFANATPPSAYKGQTMNGFSGGSLYMRTPVKTYQLATMQAPSLSIGCGGIDLTAGAFSFINKSALIGLFKNIGTSISYAFLLAIQSSMPEMANLFKNLQDVANKVNSMQINSCELGSGIATKGMSSITESLNSTFSQVGGSLTNLFSDPLASHEATKDNAGQQNAVKAAAIAADPTKEEYLKPGNLVWRVLNKYTGLDVQDKELLMSISGTIIIGEPVSAGGKNEAPKWNYFPPAITNIKDMLGEDNAASASLYIYQCDTTTPDGCLSPINSSVTVTPFVKMVSDKIDTLQNKIISRTSQNIPDFKLVDISSIPVWRMLAASTDINPSLISNYKHMIAVDIAYVYINDLLKQVKIAVKTGQTMAGGEDGRAALKQLADGLSEMESKLQSQRLIELTNMANAAEMERQLQFLMQTMNAGIPAQAFNSMQIFTK